ncbi:MAG TPA: metalloregulator ArsR/SmtB family transcription factor [Chthoniobacterales bacterium]
MDLIQIYQCFCDANRLRILHLLAQGPLCVCHFQEILEIPQAKVSQHLAYLRKHQLVETTRHGNWMIYRLPVRRPPELEKNLQCLQDCVTSDPRFREDRERRRKAVACCDWLESACC